MAIPPLLCINWRHSGAVQVGRLLAGSTFAQIGNDVSTALGGNTANTHPAMNRVCQFKNGLYAVHSHLIFRYNPDTSDWDLVFTPANPNANSISGLHVYNKGGVPAMGFLVNQVFATMSSVETLDGINFTQTNGFAGGNAVERGKGIVFRNDIWYPWAVGTIDVLRWNPTAGAVATYNFVSADSDKQSYDFCVFDNQLYLLIAVSAAAASLYKFDLGNFQFVQSLTEPQAAAAGQENSIGLSLFTDDTAMYAIHHSRNGSSANHWNLTKLTPNGATFTETSRTTNLPTDWRDGGIRTGTQNQVEVFTDNETNPTSPSIHIFHLTYDASGGTRSYYEWPGDGVNWPAAVNSVSSNYALGNPKMGGGERFWSINDLNIHMTATPIPILDAQTMTFIAEGDPVILSHGSVTGTFSIGETVTGSVSSATATVTRVNDTALTLEVGGVAGGPFVATDNLSTAGGSATNTAVAPVGGAADKTVKIFVNADEEIATTEATLQGTATGGTAIRVGNTVTQIIADGITEYTVDVAVVAMGLVPGQNVSWQFEVNP